MEDNDRRGNRDGNDRRGGGFGDRGNRGGGGFRGNRGGFGGNRGGGFRGNRGGFGGNRNFGPREMHDAVCAECKKECKVPFKPNGEKPVYCSDCFSKHKKF